MQEKLDKQKAKNKKRKEEAEFRAGVRRLSMLAAAGVDLSGASADVIESTAGLRR
jgi:hypothetical protein